MRNQIFLRRRVQLAPAGADRRLHGQLTHAEGIGVHGDLHDTALDIGFDFIGVADTGDIDRIDAVQVDNTAHRAGNQSFVQTENVVRTSVR